MSEVVVLGGGIIGASAAYNLAKQGVAVTLVDPARPGAATSAAAGVISAMVHHPVLPEWSAFAVPAMQYYPDLVAELEELGFADHSYRVIGDLTITAEEDGAAELADALERRRELLSVWGNKGVGVAEMLDADQVQEIAPLLQGATAAIWHDKIASVDGPAMRTAIQDAFVRVGGTLLTGPGALVVEHGRAVGVTVDGQRIGADAVLLAAGAWASAVAGEVGIDLDVYPQRGQITHVRLPGAGSIPVIHGVGDNYLLSYPDDRIAFGATRENEAGFSYQTTAAGIQNNIAEAIRLFPAIANAEYLETRVGFRPFTPDKVPHVGASRTVEGLYLGVGISTQGMTLGAYTGKSLAQLMTGATAAETDIPLYFTPRA
jgi:D-amino-acid dehydrogenase